MADTLTYNYAMNAHDDMEISSEAGQKDIDLDIDFDDFDEAEPAQHEEEMGDDATPVPEQEDIELRSATDNNDYMLEDDVPAYEALQEPTAELAAPVAEDEELLDLSEDDDEQIGQAPHISTEAPYETEIEGSHVEEVTYTDVGTHVEDARPEAFHEGAPPADAPLPSNEVTALDPSVEAAHIAGVESAAVQSETTVSPPANGIVANDDATAVDAPEGDDGATEAETTRGQDDAGVVAGEPSIAPESTEQPTYTGLHPTMVKYQGEWYPLFPPASTEEFADYFVQDENLVNGSIGDLLQACREMLGEAITESEELEFYVEDLQLYIMENSTAAFSVSLSEIIALFLQFHRSDGTESPPPLRVLMCAKPKFAERLALLARLAAEGAGIASLADYDHTDLNHSHSEGLTDEHETGALSGDGVDAEHIEDDLHDEEADDQDAVHSVVELEQQHVNELEGHVSDEEGKTLTPHVADEITYEDAAAAELVEDATGAALGTGDEGVAADDAPSDGAQAVAPAGEVEASEAVDADELYAAATTSERTPTPAPADSSASLAVAGDATTSTHSDEQAERSLAVSTAGASKSTDLAEDDHDELDFDDDFDDELAINKPKDSMSTPAKRGLELDVNEEEHVAKKARPSP